MKTILLTQHFR